MNHQLVSYHPIDYKEINKMNQKVDSIALRIRNVEKRLMDKKFVGGLSEWNPLLELQARITIIEQNHGPLGGNFGYVVLPTKDCIDLLNRLAKVKTKQESDYYLSMLNSINEPKELLDPNELVNPKYP